MKIPNKERKCLISRLRVHIVQYVMGFLTLLALHNFNYVTQIICRSLPCNLRMIKSFNQFKSKVRNGIHGKQD